MRLTPREQDKLLLANLGFLAQKRLARGLVLNKAEATALIAFQLQEYIRDGKHSVADLMQLGKEMLGRRHVMPGVPEAMHDVQVEGTFPDGTFLVTTHDPVCSDSGNIAHALYGSFLPVPTDAQQIKMFPIPTSRPKPSDLPGAVVVRKIRVQDRELPEPIELNKGRKRWAVQVINEGDRPVQVGSHYPFLETNPKLAFPRLLAFRHALRLDIAAGTAVRFEPGESKTVQLVEAGGRKLFSGGNGLGYGVEQGEGGELEVGRRIEAGRFRSNSEAEAGVREVLEPRTMDREIYASMFGPTMGDRVRLGDSNLWVEVEKDYTVYGDECKFGGGKTLRDGQGQASNLSDRDVLDLVVTNALVIDWSGICKADIGVKNGKIAGIGKAGNPDIMDGIAPDMIVGSSTEVIAGEKLILTAGAIDAHVHYICPQLWEEALSSGITTLIGGGTGPSAGSCATTCTSSKFYMQTMFAATDGIPLNFAFTGKGNDSGKDLGAMRDIVEAGAAGLKLHEDWGSTPECIDRALQIGDEYDVQVNIHTDTLNESGFVESTIAAIKGRTIHTYHTEGAGGGHAPDIIVVCEHPNVLPSSTNPTRPYAKNTLDEHLDMLMVCHHLDKSIPEDIAFADSRIRAETVAAEDVLHDSGAISMISSDSQAMGRIGEVIARTWRTAAKMRDLRGPLEGDAPGNDNNRVKRYIAKYTINPAITHGISHVVGQIATGTLADFVLWRPENFGTKAETIVKGGVIAWAQMGDANASIPTVQPVIGRPMWGAQPAAAARNSLNFVSKASIDNGTMASYGLGKAASAVVKCRDISKLDMKHNTSLPKMTVDPETYEVRADGELCDVEPATVLPLTKKHFVF